VRIGALVLPDRLLRSCPAGTGPVPRSPRPWCRAILPQLPGPDRGALDSSSPAAEICRPHAPPPPQHGDDVRCWAPGRWCPGQIPSGSRARPRHTGHVRASADGDEPVRPSCRPDGIGDDLARDE
jgi:hypothetical protein